YANNVIYNVKDVCDEEKVTHPIIMSESGRAIVSHHSVIVTECNSIIKKRQPIDLTKIKRNHKLINSILEINENLDKYHPRESFHDLEQDKEQAQILFNYGYLDIETMATIDNLYWEIAHSIYDIMKEKQLNLEEMNILDEMFADQYLLNFSVFQSIPDHWAIDQVFPIMPIHRLNESPTVNGKLVDITCDSDGKVQNFIQSDENNKIIPLHPLKENQPYYLAFFLTGAYQDIMGNTHNLFGRINEVHVYLDENEEAGWYIENFIPGDKISDVLEEKDYSLSFLKNRLKKQVDLAIKNDTIKPSLGMDILAQLENQLNDYTYMKRKK
ncbi:MAG: arginine decarboxylase, partial [Spirochaetes bacterium]|nr:arginine decarboxylase [Spirochaetota bacterium]